MMPLWYWAVDSELLSNCESSHLDMWIHFAHALWVILALSLAKSLFN